jgi:hydroxyacylglutathione hydrolase
MFFRRFYDTKLAQASYLIGCQRTGEAIVVDPNRDVQQYIDAASREGLRVAQVTETHIHADFVSGARELALRTDATLVLSAEGGADWQYGFARDAGARLVRDGDRLMVGNIRLDVMHTPGHTPEHISFLVTDTPAGAGPWGILTGDFVFVGDVGRPDLLERAAGFVGTMESAAHTLFHSLERFRRLPDHLQVWPGHGAGSACGKALGAIESTTVGYEKLANWGVATKDEDEFVRMVLDGQPEPPRYFAEMKRINREGPRILGARARPPRVGAKELDAVLSAGDPIVDTRSASEFAAGHLPGALNIPLDERFTTWAGWLLPYHRDVYLLVDHSSCAHCVDTAVRDLAMIGLDRVAGIVGADLLGTWTASDRDLEFVAKSSASEASAQLERGLTTLVDVRGRAEWASGHARGAINIPLGELSTRLAELPTDRTVSVQCQSGARSAMAASLLQALGRDDVQDVVGGFEAWQRAGLPVGHGAPRTLLEPAHSA